MTDYSTIAESNNFIRLDRINEAILKSYFAATSEIKWKL